jgi:hypothetical protein
MSHGLVKITVDEDGQPVHKEDQKWCFVTKSGGAPTALCAGEVFGSGEGAAEYKYKEVSRGVPCLHCKEIIKEFKAVKF